MTALKFYGDRPPGVGTEGEMLPGRLIVIEGTDGVGRSTQIALLKEWLEDRGYAVVSTGLRRSLLAARGIERAKRGNTLDTMTLNLLYATDFWDRLERHIIPALRAGMVALVDRYIFSLIARAAVRGVPREWMQGVYGMALVPDRVIYLDIDVPTLTPRVLGSTGFDYWESGDDYLTQPDLYQKFVQYQTDLLAALRSLAEDYQCKVIDARGTVADVFAPLLVEVQEVICDMAEEPAASGNDIPRRPSPTV